MSPTPHASWRASTRTHSASARRQAARSTAPTHRRRDAIMVRATLALSVLLAAGCMAEPRDRITDPASPQAADIDRLWTLSLWLGTAVWVAVMVLLAVPILRSWRRHRDVADKPEAGARNPATNAGTDAADTAPDASSTHPETSDTDLETSDAAPDGRDASRTAGALTRMLHVPPGAELDEPVVTADPADAEAAQRDLRVRARLLWLGGIVGPALILIGLLVASGNVGASTAHVERDGELVIDVRGHMFWWEVHYPAEEITTANEIHVPVDRPVRLRLTTQDVIHSFWIPRVHGKVDMIPGQENWLSFEATETGRFRGQCAEFCGIAHAQMVAFLEVHEPEDYDAWVEREQRDAVEPGTDRAVAGQRVFFDAGCASCHAVSGTGAVATVGPDLTHIASRETLAAGIVPNTREQLAALILTPWEVKPGNPMPPTRLDDDELDALLDYLEVLE